MNGSDRPPIACRPDRPRIAAVVQRYGLEVAGGSELLCRTVVERLSATHDVEVLTTRAVAYTTWANEYPPGPTLVNDIPVRRFSVDYCRPSRDFDRASDLVFNHPHTLKDELRWADLQGPYVPELLTWLERRRESYDAFLFFTYLYFPTCRGLPIVADRSVLVPTAHDEPPIYLSIYEPVFNSARELLFLTEEEGDFVRRRFCMPDSRGEVAGAGLDISDDACSGAEWEELSSRIGESKFIAYVGRVDESKGCAVLLEYFRRYVAERPDCDINLVLVGDDVMKTWEHPRIIRAGFVSRKCRDAVIRNCAFLAMPSPFESLCFAVLEAWALGRPVLVNGNCSVLRAHCERSNGGLWYTDYEQFRECTDRLLGGERLSRTLGEQGRAYVEADYTWDRTIGVYTRALARAAGRPAAGEVS